VGEKEREREGQREREKEILFPHVSFKEQAAKSANMSEAGAEVFEIYPL